MDLTGGTAFTAKQEIWEHSLLELWRDDRLINIRKNFMNEKVQLKVCQRYLAALSNHTLYTNDHPFDTVFSPKSKDLFPSNSLGYPRLSSRWKSYCHHRGDKSGIFTLLIKKVSFQLAGNS